MPGPFDDLVPKAQGTSAAQDAPKQADPFSDLVPNQPQQSPDQGAFMAAVDGWNRAFGRVAEGTLQVIGNVLPDKFNERLEQYHNKQESEYKDVSQQHPVASSVGEFSGYLAQGAAIPTSAASPLARIASTALAGGAVGAVQYGTPTERLERGVIGAAAGGLLAGAGEAYRAIKPSPDQSGFLAKMMNPEGAAAKDITAQVRAEGGLPAIAQRGAAAQRLGVPLTPGETLGGRVLPESEKAIRLTDQSSRLAAADFVKGRETALKSSVNKMINAFVPEGDDVAKATRQKLYDAVAPLNVQDDIMAKLKTNPIIDDEIKSLNEARRVTAEVRNLPDNSVLKLDKIKQQIDDQLYNNKSIVQNQEKTLSSEERRALQEARKQLVGTLDEIAPEYKQARQISERIIMKRKLLDDVATIKPKERSAPDEVTLDQMYDKLWATPEKQSHFLDAVTSSGGDTQTAQDILQVLNQVRKSPLESLLKKPEMSGSVSVGQAPEGAVQQFIQKLVAGDYNKKLLELTLDSDKWQAAVKTALDKPNNSTMMMSFKNILDKVKSTIGQYKKEADDLDVTKMSVGPSGKPQKLKEVLNQEKRYGYDQPSSKYDTRNDSQYKPTDSYLDQGEPLEYNGPGYLGR